MNYKIKDIQSEVSLRIDRAKEELLDLRLELEDGLLAVEDMKHLPLAARESLQRAVQEAYTDLIDEVQEVISRNEDIVKDLGEKHLLSWAV